MASQASKDAPLCFVLMPFGLKSDPSGGPSIDFDSIYAQAIKPAIQATGLEPIRFTIKHSTNVVADGTTHQ